MLIKRVVVVGATGFVGSALLMHFNKQKIETLEISSNQLRNLGQYSIEYLTENLRATDTVIMLSAITPDKAKNNVEAFVKNIKIAEVVCGALQRKQCSNVIYFSSDAIYPFCNEVISEETRPSPSSLYGMMHLSREKMFEETVKTKLLIVRSTQIYGFLDTHNSYGPCRMLRSAIKEGKIYIFGDGSETRDHVFINDLVLFIDFLLQFDCVGVVNAVSGQSISFAEVACIIKDILKKKVEIISIPRKNPVTHRKFDNSKFIKKFTDFTWVSLEIGLSKMYQDFLKKSI